MLVDSDVLIWYMRGNQKAKEAIDRLDSFSISTVTYMELIQGIRNREELRLLRRFITQRQIKIVHINDEISQKALHYMEEYALSHNLRMADSLIAATASILGTTLLTSNTRHYLPIRDIQVKRFKP
jgi:predicted nucleic acid-binding protein